MQETKAALRYARSLFQLAVERNELEAVSADMDLIHRTILENRELAVMLKSPIIKADKKASIIRAIFEGKIGGTTVAFLNLIIQKRREMHIGQIAHSFVTLYLASNGIEEATLTTAFPIDEAFRRRVTGIVENISGSKVELEEKIDPSIIGGFVLRFGDKQIDASVEREIELLRREFDKNLYVKDY